MVGHRKKSRGKVYPVYECVKRSRASGLCTPHSISTDVLDVAVWARVHHLLTQPSVVLAEFQRTNQEDNSADELAGIERALTTVARTQGNLSRALALFEEPEAAVPVVKQLEALRDQQKGVGDGARTSTQPEGRFRCGRETHQRPPGLVPECGCPSRRVHLRAAANGARRARGASTRLAD